MILNRGLQIGQKTIELTDDVFAASLVMPCTSFRTLSLDTELFALDRYDFQIEFEDDLAPIVFDEYIVNETTSSETKGGSFEHGEHVAGRACVPFLFVLQLRVHFNGLFEKITDLIGIVHTDRCHIGRFLNETDQSVRQVPMARLGRIAYPSLSRFVGTRSFRSQDLFDGIEATLDATE